MNDINVQAIRVVREAGELLKKTNPGKSKVYEKGFANYVTEVDIAVQEFLIPRLLEIIPGSNIISEEVEENHWDITKPTWVLDPIDGTTNFIYDYKCSAISLALFLGGKPNFGVIYNPATNEMFTAQAEQGAFLNESPIQVSRNNKLEKCLLAFGTTPYDRTKTDATFDILKKVYSSCRDIRRSGSAALDIAYVACGRVDGYFELKIQPWDYAAGIIILKEAGGIITDWNGESLEQLKPSSVLATNCLVHEELKKIILQV
ncbi:MAG: inositol monophosphatase/fructose,6-bisphosphatase family protein [Clostridiales bacterium]|nr:inositol monophosphatase/fructose,6-bisphosphatase family protein [Clostridiales bacterium]